MKLYYAPSACSLSPHIVLLEAGLTFELVRVDTKTHTLDGGGDFCVVNPKGYVPVLELDDGQRLTEGAAIVQYLADLKPESKLAPAAGTLERVRLQEWLNFLASEVHKEYAPLFHDAPEERKAEARAKLGRRFELIADALEEAPFLLGSTFGVADAYLYVLLSWARATDIDLSQWPPLERFVDRVSQRPSVKAALEAEKRPASAAA